MPETDATLMLQFQQGSTASFDTLVRRHQQHVANILYQFLGDRDEAEDLAIEVFLRVYEAKSRYRPEAKFTTWLYRIVRNLALNELRRRKRHHFISLFHHTVNDQGEDEEELVAQLPHSGTTPQVQVEKNEQHRLLRRAIDALPERQRLALSLWLEGEWSHKELAQILGCSIKSVERRLYWARKNLKQQLTSLTPNSDERGFCAMPGLQLEE